jgi:hypothetical protein
MNPNAALSEQLKFVTYAPIAAVANTAKFTVWVDMSKHDRFLSYASLGDMANETVDHGIYYADDSSGTNPVAVTGGQNTQRAASASANDSKQLIAEITAADMPAGKKWAAGRLVTGGATGGAAFIIGIAAVNRYDPVVQETSVVEVVK